MYVNIPIAEGRMTFLFVTTLLSTFCNSKPNEMETHQLRVNKPADVRTDVRYIHTYIYGYIYIWIWIWIYYHFAY